MTDVTTPAAAELAATPTPPRATGRASTPLTVSSVERLTEDAVAVTFAVPEDLVEEYRFEPGQHLTLRATINGEEVRQSYSICQSRRADRRDADLRVAAARVPEGRMSNWLNDAVAARRRRRGDDPTGSFTCPTRPDGIRHHVAIAAGSGITPVLSLLTSALEEEPGRA